MSGVPKGLKVLIVEDEADLATTCARLLRRMGHVPLVTLSGQEAVELIEREHPDLVLTDLRLPTVDGFAVLRHARRSARKIPVILFTAYTSQASRQQALEQGAAVYLPKPFTAAGLHAAVEQALAGGSERPRGGA
ncbi:MAG: response regulator [Candidatus Rokubacteria bacterium]|nr:response regulator [Candidatus Rokubacteria bacterium]